MGEYKQITEEVAQMRAKALAVRREIYRLEGMATTCEILAKSLNMAIARQMLEDELGAG